MYRRFSCLKIPNHVTCPSLHHCSRLSTSYCKWDPCIFPVFFRGAKNSIFHFFLHEEWNSMLPCILTNMSLCDLQTWDSNTGSSTQGLFACEVSLQTLHCRSLNKLYQGTLLITWRTWWSSAAVSIRHKAFWLLPNVEKGLKGEKII